jgi:hypothetical protein
MVAVRREYAGTAAAARLTADIGTGIVPIPCDDLAGWPTGGVGPFFVVIGRGTPSEEKLLIASRSTNTLTVSARGVDGSAAVAHGLDDVIEHVFTATEADEANDHIMSSTDVHGVLGSVVGTSDTQTLFNKTISGANNTLSGIPSSAVTGLDSHTGASAAHGATGAIVGTTNTQTLTNKTLTAPVIGSIVNTGTLTLPTSTDTLVGRATSDTLLNKTISGASNSITAIASSAVTGLDAHIAADLAHGATGAVVGTTNTQTLTNKTLTAPTITSPVVTGLELDGYDVSGAWDPYTPTWDASGTDPAIGNGVLTGRFKRIGNTVKFRILLVAGSTTTFGTGTWTWTLPNGWSVYDYAGPGEPVGTALTRDNSPVTRYPMHVYCNTASTVAIIFYDGTIVGQTYPWTWANGDSLILKGEFEIA